MNDSNAPAPLRYLSLFSGVGGFDLGFDRAGMTCAGQVEYDEKARAVLAKHWPDVMRINDVREVQGDEFGTVDLICGGFPCQDVSVAGKRAGLAGERSGLWFDFHRLIDRVRPRWVVIENVPGLLSSHGGRDFAVILRGLVGCGYGVAWRVLDAQYFGVPQRRRRVFIVGSLGNGRAAEILFEREGGAGDSAPGRGPRPELARDVAASLRFGGEGQRGRLMDNEHGLALAPYVMAHGQGNAEVVKDGSPSLTANHEAPIVAATLNSGGNNGGFRTEPGEHLVAVAFQPGNLQRRAGSPPSMSVWPTLGAESNGDMAPHVFAFTERTRPDGRTFEAQEDLAYALTNPGSGGRTHSRQIAGSFGVRRLTPVECERLQGFPDNWTESGWEHPSPEYVAECARKGIVPESYVKRRLSDSARYRQMGNAVAVPVAEWIGRRIVASNYG